MTLTTQVLHSSSLVSVVEHTCTTWAERDDERSDPMSSITIIRRGLYAYHARREVTLAEPGLVTLCRGNEPYSLSHPFRRDVPDRSTRIELADDLTEEAFGANALARELGTHLSPRTQMLHLQTLAALSEPGTNGNDPLAAEELMVGLLHAVAADFDVPREDTQSPARRRDRVQQARALIAARPETNLSLEAVATAAGCSPFHLARLFRQETGMTLRGYRLRLRLALVLNYLAEGATDLSYVAHEVGFSDHSHMAKSFQKVFGCPPSSLRDQLGSAGLVCHSRFLQAAAEQEA